MAVVPTPTAQTVFSVAVPPGIYFVRVRAQGPGGMSAPSSDVRVHTGTALPPSTPSSLLAAVQGSVVAFSWQGTYEGGVPSGAMLSVSGAASAEFALPPGEQAAFAGVPPGTYTVTLRAVNGAGPSTGTPPVTFVVPTGCSAAPAAPVNVTSYVVGRHVSLLWDSPTTGGAPSAYVVDVAGVGSLSTPSRGFETDAPPGSYSLTVRAVNACGASAPSAALIVTVP